MAPKEPDQLVTHGQTSDTGEPPAPPHLSNGLLEALIYVARHHGLSANTAEVMNGIAASQQGLTLASLDEAASRIGLKSKIERHRPSKIPSVVLPAILIGEDQSARVVLSLDQQTREAVVVSPLETTNTERDPEHHTENSLDNGSEKSPANVTGRSTETVSFRDLDRVKQAIVIYLTADQIGLSQPHTSTHGPHWFWSAVRRMWPNYTQVVVAALIGNVLALASPLFVMNVYDRVIPNLATATLWVLTTGVVLAFLFDFVLKLLRMRIVDETGRRVDMAVSGRIFDHLLAMQLANRPASTGTTVNRVRDLDTIRDAMTSSSVIAATDCLFIAVFLVVMWMLVGPLVLVPALAVPLLLSATLLFQRPLARALAESQDDIAKRQSLLAETVSALETVKVIGAESWLRRAWDRSVAAASRSTTKARYWSNLTASFSGLVSNAVSIIIVVWGVYLVIGGTISIGALIAANILSGRVLGPLNNIAQTITRLQQAATALKALDRMMEAPSERIFTARDMGASTYSSLRVGHLSLTYPGATKPALDDVSFHIEPGERVGIIGKVGSGKSTILHVLAGLYDPSSGGVFRNGVDIRQYSKAALRSEIGLCLQEAELFTGTLRDNLLLGQPFASPEAIERAVALSGVNIFAADHPAGLEMPIAERGRSLSGGQRHAVSLARCLIRSPQIICLDEPTAQMDMASERAVCQNLKTLADTGITLVIATHRDGPLDLVDRLLVFDQGRLVADGPKAEVMTRLKERALGSQSATSSGSKSGAALSGTVKSSASHEGSS